MPAALALSVPVLLAAVATLVGLADLVANPTVRRMAVRNVARRPVESILIVLGTLLGAAIIVATLVVGDTLTASIRDGARTRLGPLDVVVAEPGATGADALVDEVRRLGPPEVDGVVALVTTGATVTVAGASGAVEPRVTVAEGDFAELRDFGGEPGATGFESAGDTPTRDEVVVNERLARQLDAVAGDRLEVYIAGRLVEGTVARVLPELGLAGFAGVWLAPGTIARVVTEAGDAAVAATPPRSVAAVSLEGGVFDAVDAGSTVTMLRGELGGRTGVEITPRKEDTLRQAERVGNRLSRLFLIVGSFSVITGIALLVNLFVMLAEERRREMGMLRAVGIKRLRLVRLFCAEGLLYSATAALLGVAVGSGIGWVLIRVTRNILAADDPDLVFRFSATPRSLVIGGSAGLLIAMGTIAATSVITGRLNIISAIRELPDPRRVGRRLLPLAAGVVGMVAGAAVHLVGLSAAVPPAVLLGVPLAAFSAVPLLRRVLPGRVGTVLGAAAALAWSIAVFPLHDEVMRESSETVFILQGVVLVAAAVVVTSSMDRVWSRVSGAMGAGDTGLALRLALVYPLARRFRTGMIVAMFSLVLFVMTLLTMLDAAFTGMSATAARNASVGYDLVMDTNPASVPAESTVLDLEGVDAVAVLGSAGPGFRLRPEDEPRRWRLTGIDASYLRYGAPALTARHGSFDSDAEVWRAVLEGVGTGVPWVVVNDVFLQQGAEPGASLVAPGDAVFVADPASGADRRLRVAAILESDPTFNGALVAMPALAELAPGRYAGNRWYVGVADGADAAEVAARLNRELVPYGADVRTFEAAVERILTEQLGFMALMRGFLGLGLLIGIAGLAVVMIRAVRERRREVGMLRSLGMSARVVRLAFLLEAAFIAAQGVVLGVGLGLVTGWRMTAGSDVFGTRGVDIDVPWGVLAVLAAAPFLVALLATLAPAASAARIRPAVALRIAD